MHFIPNPNNTEFIYLLGVEQCVEHILTNGKLVDPHPTPFICTQCGTDFTPSWKWDKASLKSKGEQEEDLIVGLYGYDYGVAIYLDLTLPLIS